MKAEDFTRKEEDLAAELANQVLTATNRNLVAWSLADEKSLLILLSRGYAKLLPTAALDGSDVTRFVVYSDDDNFLGGVNDGHPALAYSLSDCYRRLCAKLDPRQVEHQCRVAALTEMRDALSGVLLADGDDLAASSAEPPPAVEEDEVDELHAEDAEVAFRDDMAEQAAEFAEAAREEAATESDETLASLPGQVVSPPLSPGPPRTKKVIRRVLKRPVPPTVPFANPFPPPPPPGKSRVLDTRQ